MLHGRKALSIHGGGGGSRVQVSTMRPLAATAVGGFSAGKASSGIGGIASQVGSSLSFSQSSGFGFGGGHGFGAGFGSSSSMFGGGNEGFLSTNEKMTMQNLNDRLAAYLEKVRRLEAANMELEMKIKQLYSQGIGGAGGDTARDYSHLEKEIDDLQNKIADAAVENARILLNIDNAKLAADDFRIKYEAEGNIRAGIDADILGLRRVADDMTLNKADLEMQIESCREELDYLRKNHDEDMKVASSGIAGQVNVELDAAPSTNLLEEMDAYRKQYEAAIEKAKQEGDRLFNEKVKELNQTVTGDQKSLSSFTSEITDLRRTLQGLEIELQSQMAMKSSLERTLADTENQYGIKIQDLQQRIHVTEEQLANLRAQMMDQSQEYEELLDMKLRLELEIETYRRLLEGEGSGHCFGSGSGFGIGSGSGSGSGFGSGSGTASSTSQIKNVKTTSITKVPEPPRPVTPEEDPTKDPVVTKRVKIITETIINGVIQSTEVKENLLPVN